MVDLKDYSIIEPPHDLPKGSIEKINDILSTEECLENESDIFGEVRAINGDKLEEIKAKEENRNRKNSIDLIIHLEHKKHNNSEKRWLLVECKCGVASKKGKNIKRAIKNIGDKISDSKKLLRIYLSRSSISFLNIVFLVFSESTIKNSDKDIRERLTVISNKLKLKVEHTTSVDLTQRLND